MGNANVRQALLSLYEREMLAEFWTTVRWDPEWFVNALLPGGIRSELTRRSYPQVPGKFVHARPWREMGRLLAAKAGFRGWTAENETFFSATNVCYELDRAVAKRVWSDAPEAVYAYEDGALESFHAARQMGVRTVYELPITYWKTMHQLLEEEAELCPEWADTMPSGRDSVRKLDRKDAELQLSDMILVPCRYVKDSLPAALRDSGRVRICAYGAPPVVEGVRKKRHTKLRVLYVGGLTQRKGLAYLLRALLQVEPLVEVTLIGNPIARCRELDRALAKYRYIPSMPHAQVLSEMEDHDVLVFPSLSEGYGLVILEALSRGLAVITTRNTGAPEVMRDGREGFLVPIRSSEAIAEKLELLAGDRELLAAMQAAARKRAQECSWERYRELLSWTVQEVFRAAT
jgi:alpha-maltose-1-phosphate synthase